MTRAAGAVHEARTGRAAEQSAQRRSLILRVIYALCLLGATANHWAILLQHGLYWDYGGFPVATAIFWTSLSFLDPAAVVLLFARPNAGVAATIAIIVTDVIHNLWIEARYFPPLLRTLVQAPGVMAQIAFMLFVLATASRAWGSERLA